MYKYEIIIYWSNDDQAFIAAVCRRIVAEAMEIDLAYEANLAPTILSTEEYRENREYQTPFYRDIECESIPL